MKRFYEFIDCVPRSLLVRLNQILFVLIVVFSVSPYFVNNSRKVYKGDEWIIKESARNLIENCRTKKGEDCYRKGFESLIKKYNFSFAEKTLYALQDLDEATKSCHILAHYLSRTAVNKDPGDWKYLLDTVNVNTCGSGFLHGVLEAHLGDNPRTEFSGALGNEVCDRGTDVYRKRMCMHFMGHFFIIETFDDVAKAVPYCDMVVSPLRFDCLDGVFMEHNQKIALEDHGMAKLPEYTPEYSKELEKTCLKFQGQASTACWTEMAEVYAKTFGYNAKIIHDHCYTAPSGEAKSCYLKAAVALATYPYDVTAPKLTDICVFYKEEKAYQECAHAIISSLLYYSPKFTSRGIALCANSEGNEKWCFNHLGQELSKFVTDIKERENLCVDSPEEYKRLCTNNI